MRAILTYHSIDDSGSPISVSPASFRRHVEWLASGAVPVRPLAELLSGPGETDAVALTFDDGFRSLAETAWPLLQDHGLPATLFVPTGHVGETNTWPGGPDPGIPTLPLVDWDTLGAMAGEGLQLGSHGRRHHDLRTLEPERLAEELDRSAEALERATGARPRSFAYPYGYLNEAVVGAVGDRFELACTTELRTLDPRDDLLRLPRLDAYYLQAPGRLESFGSPRFRAWLWLRARARAVRAMLEDGAWRGSRQST
jgi:peptidoglycan/xylan/chitin deacetylase (PgdA/CDA1 family)